LISGTDFPNPKGEMGECQGGSKGEIALGTEGMLRTRQLTCFSGNGVKIPYKSKFISEMCERMMQ
jgi:hypothetical protein